MENSNSIKRLPPFFIGKAETDRRKAIFMVQKHSKLSADLGREDTKSVWYTREHIAKLLEEIDIAQGDGLTIHFGVYGEEHPYAGQTCLLMNVTRNRQDIYLENEPLFYQRLGDTPKEALLSELNPRDHNTGFPCPPRCSGGGPDIPA